MNLPEYTEHLVKKMSESAVCVSLFTDNYKEGTESLLQFAVAMMLDKPIYLLVPRGTAIPRNVQKVAQGMEYFDLGNPDSLADATKRLLHLTDGGRDE